MPEINLFTGNWQYFHQALNPLLRAQKNRPCLNDKSVRQFDLVYWDICVQVIEGRLFGDSAHSVTTTATPQVYERPRLS